MARLQKCPSDTLCIHGACKGADMLADRAADALGFARKPYPANWNLYGRAAGTIRNLLMLTENADVSIVLAFHENIAASKGTAHMIKLAQEHNIPIELITQ